MSNEAAVWTCAICAGISGLMLLRGLVQLRLSVASYRKESSRFPMYAARDRLVLIAASGKVSSEDKAWQAAYRGINGALDLHRESDALTVLRKYIVFLEELQSSELLQERVRQARRNEEKIARRSAEFREALDLSDDAFMYMVWRQSSWWHHLAVDFEFWRFRRKLRSRTRSNRKNPGRARGRRASTRQSTSTDLEQPVSKTPGRGQLAVCFDSYASMAS